MKGHSCYLVLKDYAYAEWFPSKRKAMNALGIVQSHFNISTLEYDDWYLSESYPWNFWRIRLDIYAEIIRKTDDWKTYWKTTDEFKNWLSEQENKHLLNDKSNKD
jgi:hypothetical protein